MTRGQKERYFDRAYIAMTPQDSFLMCQHGERMDMKEMEDIVEGYIKIVSTVIAPHLADEKGVSIRMVVNEEGKLRGLDWNTKATTLYGHSQDYIVGNALIVGAKGNELIALKRSAAEKIMRVFRLEHNEIEENGMTMEEFLKKTEEEREEA